MPIRLFSTPKTLPKKRRTNHNHTCIDKSSSAVLVVPLSLMIGVAMLLGCVVPKKIAILASEAGLGPQLIYSDGLSGTIQAHESGIWDIAFTPDGSMLATASEDGTARLWLLESHQMLREFPPSE